MSPHDDDEPKLFADEQRLDRVKHLSRNTNSGKKIEAVIATALLEFGYDFQPQKQLGTRPAGTKHHVDFVVMRAHRKVVVSSKWQGKRGTGEDKLLHEASSLAWLLRQKPEVAKAYIVLVGKGFTHKIRQYYLSGSFRNEANGTTRVDAIDIDEFLTLLAKGKL